MVWRPRGLSHARLAAAGVPREEQGQHAARSCTGLCQRPGARGQRLRPACCLWPFVVRCPCILGWGQRCRTGSCHWVSSSLMMPPSVDPALLWVVEFACIWLLRPEPIADPGAAVQLRASLCLKVEIYV